MQPIPHREGSAVRASVPSRWMHFSVWCLTGSGLLASSFCVIADRWWVGDLIANLRVQLVAALLCVVVLLLLMRRKTPAALILTATLWHMTWLLPGLMPLQNQTVRSSDDRLKILTVNVLKSNDDLQGILRLLNDSDADVIAIQELGEELSSLLQTDLSNQYPFACLRPDHRGAFGIGLISRLPIRDVDVQFFTDRRIPSIEATVDWNSEDIRLLVTHAVPPVSREAFINRNLQLQALSERVWNSRHSDPSTPVVIVGDLNVTPWSPHFVQLEQSARLQSVSRGKGLQPTWFFRPMFLTGLILDHGLHTDDMTCISRRVLPDIGSDHRPVLVELVRRNPVAGK
jgi:endonuclease/exonuclease/phosphatase (EEP) superfamily protein YafD